ncbi:MAG: site-specific DNA-methyltransferase [Verrucomicrobia bacterium]|jgi:adenine-specific DNA-methyltransferase|nr:site-specific DNA-methyltransferase [Verrucomicrobiota bacterium]
MPESNALQRLQALLRDLFQYDYADLDFGIYRLLRLKRGEVEAFLTEQLPRRVDEVFKGAVGDVHAQLERELAGLAERVRQEIDAEALAPTGEIKEDHRHQKAKAARELIAAYEAKRQQVQEIQVSEEQKAEVFNHLWAFFSRYYEAGDFIPKRRYGARETYAVPYNGEEVFFHWANRDQHYVKTAESLRDYAFTVGMLGQPCRVRFTLTEASLPPGNTKGDTRYFFPLPKEAAWDKATRMFTLPFHYRLPTETEIEKHGKNSRLQESVLQAALPKIIEAVPEAGLKARLAEIVEPKQNEETSLLLKRLRHFCRKNSSDYFIHKNLDGFLRRELEFYLKDQVLHLADLDGDLPGKQRTLRVIRKLAEEVIQFLAQIENVQKRLFEKRKFVLKTDYLVPIQNVPRELWKEVAGNAGQLAAWKELFAIDPPADQRAGSKKVNEKFLAEHPTLVVNTAHFNAPFKERLLTAFDDVDEATDGLLICSENYQALRFLLRKCAAGVDCIYIDPPYNTGDSQIPYKNGYLFSSWVALMEGRLTEAMKLVTKDAILFIAIDDFEMADLCQVMDREFPYLRREMIVVNHHPQGGKAKTFATTHEYMLVCVRRDCARALAGREDSETTERRPFKRSGTAESNFRKGRPNSFYAVLADPETKKVVGLEPRPDGDYPTGPTEDGRIRIYPVGEQEEERVWRRSYESALGLLREGKLVCSDAMTVYQLIEAGDRTPALFSNWVDRRYNAGTYGANLLADIIGKHNPFAYPKSIHTVGDALFAGRLEDDNVCLDFFGGSGTTGHAVINLNREDGEQRKFIIVEMGEHFDTVLVPRIQKVMFTPEWKSGKPVRMATKEEAERTPRLVKVLRLEGYEDALHNLVSDETLEREAPRAKAIKGKVGDDAYRLTYMARLPVEASASMLNLAKLEHPFAYTIEVLGEDGPRTETVDLVETFNFLYGLHVQRIERWRDEAAKRDYRAVKAKKADGRRVLVLWRDMDKLDPAVERKFLEARLKQDGPFDEAWINGDCAVPGVRSLDGLFKRLLEEEER